MTTRRPAPTRLALAAALALPLAVVPAARAAAQAPAPAVIDACWVPATGTLYRINTSRSPAPGAPSACLGAAHQPLAWSVAGPQGAQGAQGVQGPAGAAGAKGDRGPAGVSGYEVVEKSLEMNAVGVTTTLFARCSEGKVVLGGGGEFPIGDGTISATAPASAVLGARTEWMVSARAARSGTWLRAWAICGNVSP